MAEPDCLFCKIAAGELPLYKVYEDAEFLAFLDIHPQGAGHVQIIPKKHYRWVWDVPEPGRYFEVAAQIANAQRKAFGTDWILSRIVGDEVHHAHIWVYPNRNIPDDPRDFERNAEKIRQNL